MMEYEGGGLKALIGLAEKRFGKGVLMDMSEAANAVIRVIPTGSIALDVALGVGGLPRGRIIEIYGPEASGKTTLALHAIAEAQRAGGMAAFIDAEHAFDPKYAQTLGVDLSRLVVSHPDCGEQAIEIVELLTRSGEVALVVVDSVAALTPRVEIEGDVGAYEGLQARLMSLAMRKLAAVTNRNDTTVIFINQLRPKVGVTFGSTETTCGGNALGFYASVRLDIRRIGTLKRGDNEVFGSRTRVKVAKNNVATPFTICEFDIVFGRGICAAGEVLDLGVKLGVLEKTGDWYAHAGEHLGQGRDRVRDLLEADPERLAVLRAEVRARAVAWALAANAADTE